MINKPTRWQLISQAVLNLAMIFALICGGIWALYEFFALRSAEVAEAQLRKLQVEIRQLALQEQRNNLEINAMEIEYDEAKNERNIEVRGISFELAIVFTSRQEVLRVISLRKANQREVYQYERTRKS